MSVTATPVFPQAVNTSGGIITSSTTANTKSDGSGTIGTDLIKVWTAGANGSRLKRIRFSPVGSSAATATAATTLRAFLSSLTSGATANTNTFLLGELSAAAQTTDHSTNATFPLEIPLNMDVPAGWTILASTHIAANANTAWQIIVEAQDY